MLLHSKDKKMVYSGQGVGELEIKQFVQWKSLKNENPPHLGKKTKQTQTNEQQRSGTLRFLRNETKRTLGISTDMESRSLTGFTRHL